MTDNADEYDAYFHPLGEGDLKKFDDLCDQFTAIQSPSKASTSRANLPEPEETNTSETDEIDVPPSAEPSMSPDRTTKSSGPQLRPRKSTPGKRTSARSNSPLAIRSSQCPTPRQSSTKTKPLLLRNPSPDKAEQSTTPTHESKPPPAKTAAPVPVPSASLLKLFRPKGRFSVTDLVTPSWCEYKFDYSLRGQRWRGANMDEVVVSKHGKAIPVQKAVVIQAEKVMKQGQARVHVHKKLEDALPVVEVIVKVKTAEERFALRLLNMIAHFQMLIDIGTCREFNVMGFINGYYVTGIIDEINRLPAPETAPSPLAKLPLGLRSRPPRTPSPSPRKRKPRPTVEDSSQRKIDSFFSPSPSKKTASKSRRLDPIGSPAGVISINSDIDEDSDVEMKRASQESKDEATVAGPPSSTPPEVEMRSANASQESEPPSASQTTDQIRGDRSTYRLHLNDTKTRSVNSMPKDDLSGRLQLMLYHQLLGQLVGAARLPPTTSSSTSSSPLSFTFSFPAIMGHLHLTSSRTFSDEFIAEATGLLDSFDAFSASSQKSSQGSQEKKDGSQSSAGYRLVRNLDDLVQCWYSTVRRLRLQVDAPIDGELELIYRMREEVRTRTKGKGKGKTKSGDKQASFGAKEAPLRLTTLGQMVSPTRETMSPEALDVMEEQMMQHAIVESLKSRVHDSQSSNGTDFYTPFESPSQDPDYKPPGTIDLGDDSGKAKAPDPLPTPPPSSPRPVPADTTASSSTSESRAPSPRGEKDEIALQNEAVEDHIADVVSASQGSDMDWEALFEEIPDEMVAAVEIPATSLSPVKKNQVRKKGSKGKGKEKAPLIDTTSVSENSTVKPVAAVTSNGDAGVIGSKKFSFDRGLLTKQIVAAIEFWESKREPRGVDLEDTWKCDTCEFREGCEWREAKAAELLRSRPAK